MTERRALADPAVQQALGRKRNKYNARRTEVDGIVFDSAKEARRYSELRLLEQAGEIRGLMCQPSFGLHVKGIRVAKYIPDFQYLDCQTGEKVVEDVKGVRTPVYRLKAKMLAAQYGILVREL